MYSLINKSTSWADEEGRETDVVYTLSPLLFPEDDVPEPPVAKPETEKTISPTSEDGANHSTTHYPDIVLELCCTLLPFSSVF